MRQAEREMDSAERLACQLHDLTIETAGKVTDDGGVHRRLLLALNELTTASRSTTTAPGFGSGPFLC